MGEKIREHLKKFREAAGLTQKQLGAMAGKRGKRNPGLRERKVRYSVKRPDLHYGGIEDFLCRSGKRQ